MGRRNFFLNIQISWKLHVCYPNYLGRCVCPHGPYIVDYRNWGSGVKVGDQAPRLKILNFWLDTLVLYFGPLFFLHCDSRGDGSKRVNWKKVLSPYNPPKMGFENFRGHGTFLVFLLRVRYPPSVRFLLHPGGPRFLNGGIAPHLGKYGCLKIIEIWRLGVLCPQLSRNVIEIFSTSLCQWTLF